MREAGGFPLRQQARHAWSYAPGLPTKWRDLSVSDLAAVLATQNPSGANAEDESEAGEPDVAEEI